MKKALIVLAAVSVLFAATLVFSTVYLFGVNVKSVTITVPDCVGKKLDELSFDKDFAVEIEGEYSDNTPKGVVLSQMPFGGAERKLAKGDTCNIRLIVSLGKKSERMPQLIGFNYIEAANILREFLGAEVRIVTVYDDHAQQDAVIRTLPEAGSPISRGDRVTVFVGRKHIKKAVKVGDYCGRKQSEAVLEILSSGLNISEIKSEYSIAQPEGYVIRQSIKPGATVPYGSEIVLVVSGGNEKSPRIKFRWGLKRKNTEGGEINGE